MKFTKLNEGRIDKFLERYKSLFENVKIRQPNSLFEVKGDFRAIKEDRCPWCNCKLRFLRNRPMVMCLSKKCISDPKFKMRVDNYYKLKDSVIHSYPLTTKYKGI